MGADQPVAGTHTLNGRSPTPSRSRAGSLDGTLESGARRTLALVVRPLGHRDIPPAGPPTRLTDRTLRSVKEERANEALRK